MVVLGIDSSTDSLSIGLANDSGILVDKTHDSIREHASRIIDMIDMVITEANINKTDIQGIASAIGPGSFTGLRIGMSVAKGMAYALEIPIIGISTFEVIAHRLINDYETFILTGKVRKGELYYCKFEKEFSTLPTISLIKIDKLRENAGNIPVGFIGRQTPDWLLDTADAIPSIKTDVSGAELALIGRGKLLEGETHDAGTLVPMYIAPSQAEEKFGKNKS